MSANLPSPVITTSAHVRRDSIFENVTALESVESLSVRTSATFNVAPSRLFNAVTIPEYIETWLTPPDVSEVWCTGNPAAGDALSIELQHNQRVAVSILAEYKNISAQDLNVRWYVRSRTSTHISHLRIAIRTVRADAILRIRHSGFTNLSDWRWHQELWGLSLAKMQILIR